MLIGRLSVWDWCCLVGTDSGRPCWILILENIFSLRVFVGLDKEFFPPTKKNVAFCKKTKKFSFII